MPRYKQFGAPVQLKPGVKYLAIEIVEANDLPATDENGSELYAEPSCWISCSIRLLLLPC